MKGIETGWLITGMVAMALLAGGVLGDTTQRQKNGIGSFDIEKVRQAVTQPANALTVDSASDAPTAVKSESIGWLMARMGFYLALVIGAIYAVMWFVKRFGLAGRSKIGGGSMDTLEVLPLGPNRAVMLVRVTDRVYLLAQTPGAISVLDKIEGEKAIEVIASSKGVVSISQFKDVFSSFMGKIKKNP